LSSISYTWTLYEIADTSSNNASRKRRDMETLSEDSLVEIEAESHAATGNVAVSLEQLYKFSRAMNIGYIFFNLSIALKKPVN